MYVLSNSSKRRVITEEQLKLLGLDPEVMFEDIVTSGEVGWNVLKWATDAVQNNDLQQTDRNINSTLKYLPPLHFLETFLSSIPPRSPSTPLRVYTFGANPTSDAPYVKSTGCVVTYKITDADIILALGTGCVIDEFSNNLTPLGTTDTEFYEEKVRSVFEILAKDSESLPPMLCCNPDMIRPDVSKSIMPGTIAAWYEEFGGDVHRVGKPYCGMMSCLGLSDVDLKNIWMVGDSKYTDLGFASSAGIKGVWCWGDGIHADDIREGKMGIEYGNGVVVESFKDIEVL